MELGAVSELIVTVIFSCTQLDVSIPATLTPELPIIDLSVASSVATFFVVPLSSYSNAVAETVPSTFRSPVSVIL